MISAEQASKRTVELSLSNDEKVQAVIADIEKKVSEAIRNGKFKITADYSGLSYSQMEVIVVFLRDLGYGADFFQYRNGQDYTLFIKWREIKNE